MDETSDTGLHPVKVVMGPNWRFWVWLKKQFSAVSLSTIGGVIAVAIGYLWHEKMEWVKVSERVVVLETEVIPVIQNTSATNALEHRVTVLEGDFKHATEEAGKPLVIETRTRKVTSGRQR